jgi:hypothetical protein
MAATFVIPRRKQYFESGFEDDHKPVGWKTATLTDAAAIVEPVM